MTNRRAFYSQKKHTDVAVCRLLSEVIITWRIKF